MQKEKKNWSQYEDNALVTLRDVRKIQKWSQIAKILEEQFEVKGKNGKRCRERYHNHLSSDVKKEVWTQEEESKLLKLHNQRGNKWAQIAKVLGRSDNAVKNHYHSKLRKGIRRINYRIQTYLKNQHKLLRNNIISKIVQTAEKIYFSDDEDKKWLAKTCYDMKNKILQQAKDSENLNLQQIQNLKSLVAQINSFNRSFKKKSKKNQKSYNELLQSEQIHSEKPKNNFSAENQQRFSQSSKQIDKESQESMNQEHLNIENFKKPHNFEYKKERKATPLCQQTTMKYKLRNSRVNQALKTKENLRKQTSVSIEIEKKIEQQKMDCKTPEVFQGIQQKNPSDFNNLINLELISSFPMGFQYFNYPIYNPLMSSFTPLGENDSLDFYRKASMGPFGIMILPTGNFMWGMNNIPQAHQENPTSPKANPNIIVHQGFTAYKKE